MLREAGPKSSDIAARHPVDFRKEIEGIEADFGSMVTKLQSGSTSGLTLDQLTLVEEHSSSLTV
jgi:hypothetical protein